MIRKAFLSIALALTLGASSVEAATTSASAPTSLTRSFTAGTNDVVPAWATGVYITLQAGGSGGDVTSGGMSGGGLKDFFAAVTPGATLTFSIGAGGASATNGGNTTLSGALQNVPVACGGAHGGSTNNNCGATNQMTSAGAVVASPTYFVPNQVGASGAGTLSCNLFDGSLSAASSLAGGCSPYGKGGLVLGASATGLGAAGAGGATPGAGTGGLVVLHYVQ